MKLIAATILAWLCLSTLADSPRPRQPPAQEAGAPAQSPYRDEKYKANILKTFPAKWRARFAERFEAFLAAERSGAWDQVEELLGELYPDEDDDPSTSYSVAEKHRYSPEQKTWMMEKIKAHPMLSFEITGVSGGSEPDPASEALEMSYLEGRARYGNADAPVATTIIAYHYNGDWFFSRQLQDGCGVPVYMPPPEFSERERAEGMMPRLSFAPQPDLPMQVFDVGEAVSVHEGWPCSLNQRVTFKVRNLNEKEIVTYHYRIEDSRGRLINWGGATVWLPPGQVFSDDDVIFTSRRPCIVFFTEIEFGDGTKWKAEQAGKGA